jgi:DNA-binding CsgD family transcriptional regulator
MGDLRYFDHSLALTGALANIQTFFLLGLAWLTLALMPKRLILPLLRITAVLSAILLLFLFFMPMGFGRSTLYMTFKIINELSAACAFYLFCFVLNNVERLAGMALIQLYYGFYYSAMDTFPAVYEAVNTWGSAAAMVVFLAAVFCCSPKRNAKHAEEISTDSNGKGSGVPFVIGLGAVHYTIICMNNYIEWTGDSISSLAFGLGAVISIVMILIIQMLKGRSALYIWLLFLVLSLLGLGALLYGTPVTVISGSFAYGLGDSLGYIIISYMCAGAIKRSKSQRMFRLYCLVSFLQYFIISGIFSYYIRYYGGPDKALAFGVVLVLISLCLLFMPLIQKRLFEADWTDGLFLRDMEEYSRPFAETEEINTTDHLNLTAREEEIFTMLLAGKAPKEIAYTLKISYDTVRFHQKNLYRKLGIQSRAELFARYMSKTNFQEGKSRRSTDLSKLDELNN